MRSMSVVSRVSGANARRMSTRFTASITASPPARTRIRPLGGRTMSTTDAAASTVALGMNSRQNSGR